MYGVFEGRFRNFASDFVSFSLSLALEANISRGITLLFGYLTNFDEKSWLICLRYVYTCHLVPELSTTGAEQSGIHPRKVLKR